MKRSVISYVGTLVVVMALGAWATAADARGGRAAGLIGGMSASEVLGGPYDRYGGFGAYPDYPATAAYVRPLGPPPGCVIRQQRLWDGYGWRWRKLRICH